MPVNIGKGEQFKPDFLAIAPNNRMPAIVDHDADGRRRAGLGVRVRRDPALPRREDRPVHSRRPARPRRGPAVAVLADGRPRADGRAEPPFRQSTRRRRSPTRSTATQRDQPALRRARPAARRPRLPRRRDYSIADMASYPWIVPYERQGQNLDDFPNLKRWFEAIRARPATSARLREGREDQFGAERQSEFGEDPVRPNRNEFGRGTINFSGVRRRRSASYWRPCRRAAR